MPTAWIYYVTRDGENTKTSLTYCKGADEKSVIASFKRIYNPRYEIRKVEMEENE